MPLQLRQTDGIEGRDIHVIGKSAVGGDGLGGKTGHGGQQRQESLGHPAPEGLDRIDSQGNGLEADPAGHGAAHIPNDEVGGAQPHLLLRLQQPTHRAQITPGAVHMQYPLPLRLQPAVEKPSPARRTVEQGAVEIRHQHQVRMGGQGGAELLLQTLPRAGRRNHGIRRTPEGCDILATVEPSHGRARNGCAAA